MIPNIFLMKRFFFTLTFFLTLTIPVIGQLKAVTESGDEVVLYNNGTWVFVNKDAVQINDIKTNSTSFSKPNKATFLVKSKKVNIGCYLDPKAWKFKAGESYDVAEFDLTSEEGDLYGMIINEKLDLPLENLAEIAVENARNAAPDLQVTFQEYRMVNGVKVLFMRMEGTIQNMRFAYYGYYYTGNGGATQFLVYSTQEVMSERSADVEALLNGFVVLSE